MMVSMDMFTLDSRHYMVTVDNYSDLYEIDRLHDLCGAGIIPKLRAHFTRHGVPVRVISDNGPVRQSLIS